MKKIYQSPAVLIDYASTEQIIATSLDINRGGDSVTNSDDILVKENRGPSDVNVWNNEW